MKKTNLFSLFSFALLFSIYSTSIGQNQQIKTDTLPKADNYSCYLRVFMEGPINGVEMKTNIFDHGQLPINQPYNVPPWNYNGTETLQVSPETDVVDWVLLEFRRTPYGPESALPETIVYRRAGLLLQDGTVTEVDGLSRIWIYAPPITNMYVVVYHRNHLAILSNTPLTEWAPAGYGYDFTDDLSKAYLEGQKELAPGLFGMIGGDCDANGIIETTDKDVCWTPEAGKTGYVPGDWNLDLQINNPDKDDIWFVNMGLESWVPGAFVCGELLTDFRDDQTYTTVLIGDQCWMAENLNIGLRIDGSIDQIDNDILEKYCFSNNESYCDEYGGLYQWDEVMKYSTIPGLEGICPTGGWYLPSDNDWCILEQHLDPSITCSSTSWRGVDGGGKLKETGYTHWNSPNTGATNSSGFTAFGGGYRYYTGVAFYQFKNSGLWWSSSENDTAAWYRQLNYDKAEIGRTIYDKHGGFSVRCLKSNLPPEIPHSPSPNSGATDQTLNIDLFWSCSDPDGDALAFDLYFGTEAEPPLKATGLSLLTYNVSALECNTLYYWKVCVYDNHGNFIEGPVWNFYTVVWACGCPIVDPRDGHSYNTVLIGDQCWMQENLNIGTQIIGGANQSNNGYIEKYCYANTASYCNTYGGLYQWNEMMQYTTTEGTQGICMDVWHIPSDEEWKELEGAVDSQYGYPDAEWDRENDFRGIDAGLNLKSNSGWGYNGSNYYKFTALPGGFRNTNGAFYALYDQAFFWTSSHPGTPAWHRFIDNNYNGVYRTADVTNKGFSLRCVKTNEPPSVPANPTPPNGSNDQPIDITLTWNCVDLDIDPITFDVYFGYNTNPPLIDSGISEFHYNLGTLIKGVTYYWKIVAMDDHENTTVGPVWNFRTLFNCGDSLYDTRDGQIYGTVLIGEQCWMAKNLNVGTYISSVDSTQTDNGIIERYCYNNDLSNCNIYGGLYIWDEMMKYTSMEGAQGICPEEWHIPTENECRIIDDFLGYNSGGKMKEIGTTHWMGPNYGATNESGFTALPGGGWINSVTNFYHGLRLNAMFYTSTFFPYEPWNPVTMELSHQHAGLVIHYYYDSISGLSVRCLKN
ncbi:MAG: hypothetical protein JW731_07140 [Bacteroidales bacterium]|nr:hypothetical protein [Bacteroidales bacterium]